MAMMHRTRLVASAGLCNRERRITLLRACENSCGHRPLPSTTKKSRRWHATNTPTQSNSGDPSTTIRTAITSFCIGTTAGVCGSLAGMGGGFVMIPLMTSSSKWVGQLQLSQHAAHGTSLFAVATTGLAGALGYQGQVDYQAAACIALSGMVTARAGALATTRLSDITLRKALGVFMLAVAPLVPAKQYLLQNGSTDNKKEDDAGDDKKATAATISDDAVSSKSWIQDYAIPLGIGSCSGFLAGMFGVGGGAVVVPALSVLTDMNHYQALGTSLTAMVLPALSGTATHFSKGNVVLRVAPFLATGAFLGAYAGSKMALSIDEDPLRYGFSGVMVVLGLRALIK